MRNLKRVLSLALASAMLFSMMVIGAGAADTDYTDASKITFKEAADVMTSIGVMQGSNGAFMPAGDLTREAAAKIITYLMLGKKDADGLKATSAPFTDVAADRWSAGSIAYCVQNGILSGDGMGNFYPEMTVNGSAFAKMLLVALGYNASTEKYVGTGWETNVAKQVAAVKLNDGLTKGLTSTLTREEAAQMSLNTLSTTLVEYTGSISVNGVVMGGTRQTVKDGSGNPVSFAATYFPALNLSAASAGDVFGRPAHAVKNGIKTVGTYPNSPIVTYTGAVEAKTVKADLSDYAALTSGASVDRNGTGTYSDFSLTDIDIAKAEIAKWSGAGRTIEVYAGTGVDKDKVAKIVVVDAYLAKIVNINKVSNTVTLSGVGSALSVNTVGKDDPCYTELSGMAKDDYVLVTIGGSTPKIQTVATPETVEGVLTAVNSANKKHTIDGTTYDVSYVAKATISLTPGTSYTAYLDTFGNLIYGAEGTATAATYAYILDGEAVGNKIDGLTHQIKVLHEDGTMEWVKVSVINDVATKDNAAVDNTTKLTAAVAGKFVTYSVKADGTYSIKTIGGTNAYTHNDTINKVDDGNGKYVDQTYTLTNVELLKGKVGFVGNGSGTATSGANTLMGTNKTTFLVQTASGSYKAYTGISNVPGFSAATGKVLVGAGTTSATMVVLYGNAAAASSDYVYFLGAGYDAGYDTELSAPIYTYKAIVKGELTTFTTTSTAGIGIGLYKVSAYSGDYGKTMIKVSANDGTVGNGNTAVVFHNSAPVLTGGTVTLNGNGYVLADDCVIYATKTSTGVANLLTAADVEFYNVNGNTISNTYLITDGTGIVTGIYFEYATA